MIDMNPSIMLVVLLILLGFSGFFSGSETALMAISKLRLRHLAETRPRRVGLVERILRRPERLIGSILLGNNLVNVAMSAIATAMAISFWGEKGIAYVTGILTLAILIFAEITPKVYAKYFNERVSFMTAPILNAIMLFFQSLCVGGDVHKQSDSNAIGRRCFTAKIASHDRRGGSDMHKDGLGRGRHHRRGEKITRAFLFTKEGIRTS